jgi:dihydroflavonol-4-reductase
MNLLVTGASGFIGSAVLRLLAQEAADVRALTRRLPVDDVVKKVRWFAGDLRNPEELRIALHGVEGVVHLAAASSSSTPEELQTVTVEGTARLAAQAVESGVRHFLLMSSSTVYGAPTAGSPWTEDAPLRPYHPYSESKVLAETRARAALSGRAMLTILRPTLVFGAESPAFSQLRNRLARQRVALTTPGDEFVNPIFVEDLARAVLCVVRNPCEGVFNVGAEVPLPLESFRDLIAAAAGVSRMRRRLPVLLAVPAARLRSALRGDSPAMAGVLLAKARGAFLNAAVDTGRLRERYGWRATPLDEALARAVVPSLAHLH